MTDREFQRTPRKNLDMDEIERLYAEGLPLAQIAKRYGTTHTTIGDRLERRGIRIRGRGEALRVLWRGRPAPLPTAAGITPATKSYFMGGVAALRTAGLSAEADELEYEAARIDELAMKFGFAVHQQTPGA